MRGPTRITPAELRRVLVRTPNWLGDTVMAVPALRALRRALPAAELWCHGRWAVSVLESEPGVSRLLGHPPGARARLRLAAELRRARIDLAVLFPNSFEAALHAWLSGARWRLGYAGDGRSSLLTHPVTPPPGRRHQVALYLDLLRPLGLDAAPAAPTLPLAAARRAEARRLLASAGMHPDTRAVAIHLGAAFGPSKLWPADRLAGLVAALERDGTPVVFLGDSTAAPLLAAVERVLGHRLRHLVGADHPALLPALLAGFGVVVSPDSGPAHLAAAVGVPVVALFGPTDPRLTAPAGDGHAALWRPPPCAPCFRPVCPIDHRCLAAITVEDVLTAVRERLSPPGQ